jgi:oligopeptide transport system substrate-binding protein
MPASVRARCALFAFLGCAAIGLTGCGPAPWNSPYPGSEEGKNILYSSFDQRPKHLDPARSYSADEAVFTGQIYEPPLQYHYLLRPYTLVPLTAAEVPQPTLLDARGAVLPADAPPAAVTYSVYEIHIRPGILYQPHPAFAKDAQGHDLYRHLTRNDLAGIRSLADFPKRGTRELVAGDYIYEIKRLAHPALQSPILGVMAEHIVGLKDYAGRLAKEYEHLKASGGENPYLDLRKYPLEGVQEVDRYTYRVKLYGRYPQFIYWLAMPFFAPVPPEAEEFYAQPGMAERNLTLDWEPVGTGPYMLTVNHPSLRMVLERNPNFHGETYPTRGEPQDVADHLLRDAGKPLPFVDKVVFSLEKEDIPRWNKFLQGYYDTSGISSDAFDQAVRLSGAGEATLSEDMRDKGIRLITSVAASIFYLGFNMLDPVVGGYDEAARKLRQAISIAIDYDEYIAIFRNGRGIVAQGPIPPGIFGHVGGERGIDPYVYDWVDGEARRKSIQVARRLLTEAGYPGGRDAKTGTPLLLYFDISATGPDAKAFLDWMRKQLAKLDLQLVIRNTDYNRFQDKIAKGNAQVFMWGWNADYPDPENFLFLLYGPNSRAKHGGENAANYENPAYDALFERMKNMDNGPERFALIQQMVQLVRRDAPWVFGFYPKDFVLYQQWYHNAKSNLMANNTLKYKRIDPALREAKRRVWNQPKVWPLGVAGGVLLLLLLPAVVAYRRQETRAPR